jgi:ferredoxin
MPTVVINGERIECDPGERILDVARRHACHIGFVCDGNGICQMCECRITQGADLLSPLTESEQMWLTQGQREEGRRLACQTSIRGEGTVELITRAEEIRLQAKGVLSPSEGESSGEHLQKLTNTMLRMSGEHITRYPANMLYTMYHLFSVRPSGKSFQRMFDDTLRVTNRLLTGEKPPVRKETSEDTEQKEGAEKK